MTMQEPVTVQVKGHGVILDRVFAEDFDPSQWQTTRHKKGRYHYVAIVGPRKEGEKGRPLLLHRLLMYAKPGELVDHINGNTLDNRKANLRKCNQGQNNRNRNARYDCKSGVKGVYFRPPNPARRQVTGKWVASIGVTIDGNFKRLHLGHFDTKAKATEAYNEAALKYHGDFARLNVVSDSGGIY